jgi:hypothetical protein
MAMRVVTLVLSFLVMLVLTAIALSYVPGYVGQRRIYVQSLADSTPEAKPYYSYGNLTVADPNHQRYYSETEGWTYYTLPADGAGQ